jgi:hypothetical protein
MKISEQALAEFMTLYNAEFNEPISKDEAAIMARNLVIFYRELYDKGVFQAALPKEREQSPTSGQEPGE